MTILAGGSDPTSAVLIQGIMQLLKSPERIARLRAELKTVILTRESHCSLLELERLEFLVWLHRYSQRGFRADAA